VSTRRKRAIPNALLRVRQQAATEAIRRIRKDRRRTTGNVRRMLGYLEKHLFDPGLQVRRLKAAVGIRDNSVALRFHAKVGSSPKVYITDRRIEVARRLLEDTNLKIWQIGELVGFSGLPVFSTRFDAVVGVRPSVYRRRARRNSTRELEMAAAGKLPQADAARLIEHLGSLYPKALALALKREGKNPAQSEEEASR